MDDTEAIATLPIPLSTLATFLQNECGLVLESHEESESFGDRLLGFRRDDLCLRFVRDRGTWGVMVTGDQEGWYDTTLLQEHILGRDSANPMTIEAQVGFLRENWRDVLQAFAATALRETRAALDERGRRRAKRLLGQSS